MKAIIAALPHEIFRLVQGFQPDHAAKKQGIWLYRMHGAVVVAAGMGADRVALAVDTALSEGADELLSVGLAGACSAEVAPGTVTDVHVVIDSQTGERYVTTSERGVVLATTPVIASRQEKARLAAAYGAKLVDMEAATVARLARAHNLPFRAIKAVSDAHDFELEGMGKFAGQRGEFRTAAFALHTALRPWTWRDAMKLGNISGRALGALGHRLREEIQ